MSHLNIFLRTVKPLNAEMYMTIVAAVSSKWDRCFISGELIGTLYDLYKSGDVKDTALFAPFVMCENIAPHVFDDIVFKLFVNKDINVDENKADSNVFSFCLEEFAMKAII